MRRKRILSFVLSLIMILGISSVTVYAQTDLGDDQGQANEMQLNTVRINGRNVFYGKELDEDQVIKYIKKSDEELLRQPARGFGFRSANTHNSDPAEWPGSDWKDIDEYTGKKFNIPIVTYWTGISFTQATFLAEFDNTFGGWIEPEGGRFHKIVPLPIGQTPNQDGWYRGETKLQLPSLATLVIAPDPRLEVDLTVRFDGKEGERGYVFAFTGRAHTGHEINWYDNDSSNRPDLEGYYNAKTKVGAFKFTIPKKNTNLVLRKSTVARKWLDREVEYPDPVVIENDVLLSCSAFGLYTLYDSYLEEGKKSGEVQGLNSVTYLYNITAVDDPNINMLKDDDGNWLVSRHGGASGFRYDFRQKLKVTFNSGEGTVNGVPGVTLGSEEGQVIGYDEGFKSALVNERGFLDPETGNVSGRVITTPSLDEVTPPDNKTPDGWTTVLNDENTKVNPDTYRFTDDTTLYAFYKDKPQEMVSITVATADTTNSEAIQQDNPFEVVKGSKFSAIKEKAEALIGLNPGYAITGWKAGGVDVDDETTFDADTTVTAQIGPRTDYSYTVKHLKEGTEEALAAVETKGDQKFGDTVTVLAKDDIEGYEPVEAQKTITIGDDGNVVTFYYREKTKVVITYEATEGGQVDPESESLNPDLGVATGSEASLWDIDGDYAFVNWTTGSGAQLEKVGEAEKFVPIKPENGPWVAVTYTANFKKKAVETVPQGDEDYYVPVTISAGKHGAFDPEGKKTVHVLKGKATAADAFKLANLDIVKNEQGTAFGLNVNQGWSFVNYMDGQGVAVNPSTIIIAAVDYTAEYKEKDSVTITYEAKPLVDGKAVGKVTPSHENLKPATDTEAKGSAASVMNDDYAFINWTDEANLKVSDKLGFRPDRPADGIWKAATYTANFKKKAVTTVPKGDEKYYVPVVISAGENGKFEPAGDKTVHVLKGIATAADALKLAGLGIDGKGITIDEGFIFDQYKDGQANSIKADTKIEAETTMTANYKASVVIVPDQNNPGETPEGYIRVEFKPVEHGTISADRIFFVQKDATLAQAKDPKLSKKPLVVPAIRAKTGYKHIGWKEAVEAGAENKPKIRALLPAPSIKVSADQVYGPQLQGFAKSFVKETIFEAQYKKVTSPTTVDKSPTLPIYHNWKDIRHFVARPVAKVEPKVEPKQAAAQVTVKPAAVPATGESRAEAYAISAVLLTAGLALLLLRRFKR